MAGFAQGINGPCQGKVRTVIGCTLIFVIHYIYSILL